jgi:hypothetical protein
MIRSANPTSGLTRLALPGIARTCLLALFVSLSGFASSARAKSTCFDLTDSVAAAQGRSDQLVSVFSQALADGPAAVEAALLQLESSLNRRELMAQDITRQALRKAGAVGEFSSERLIKQIADIQTVMDQTAPQNRSIFAKLALALKRRTIDDRARLNLKEAESRRDQTANEIETENRELAILLGGIESALSIIRNEANAADLTLSRLQVLVLNTSLSASERSTLALNLVPSLTMLQSRLQQQNLALESVLALVNQRLAANRLALDTLMRQRLALSTSSTGLNQTLEIERKRDALRKVLEAEPSVCIKKELCAGADVLYFPQPYGRPRRGRLARVDAEGVLIDYLNGTREVLPLSDVAHISFLSPHAEHLGFKVGQRVEHLSNRSDRSDRIVGVSPLEGKLLINLEYGVRVPLNEIYATEEHKPIAEYLKAKHGKVFGAKLKMTDGRYRIIGFNPWTDLFLLERVPDFSPSGLGERARREPQRRITLAAGSLYFTEGLNAAEANEPLFKEKSP